MKLGELERWGATMKPLLWTNLAVKIPSFTAEATVDLMLPCSLDFDVAANKYFYGLDAGSVAVAVMFSGTVFYFGEHGALQISQIPWDREAHFQLEVDVWKAAIECTIQTRRGCGFHEMFSTGSTDTKLLAGFLRGKAC
jgi:Family of unknown function (DUF6084)